MSDDDISFPIPSTRHCLPTGPYDIRPDASPTPPRECALVVQRWRPSTSKLDPPQELIVPHNTRMGELRALLLRRFRMKTVSLYRPKSMDVAIADLPTVRWDDDLDSALVYNVPLTMCDSVLILFCNPTGRENQPPSGCASASSSSPNRVLMVQRWRPSTNTLGGKHELSVPVDISVGQLRRQLAQSLELKEVSLSRPGCADAKGLNLMVAEWNRYLDTALIFHSPVYMRAWELMLFCDSDEYVKSRFGGRASASSSSPERVLMVRRWWPSKKVLDAWEELPVPVDISVGQLRELLAQRLGLTDVSLYNPGNMNAEILDLSKVEWNRLADSALIYDSPESLRNPNKMLFCDLPSI